MKFQIPVKIYLQRTHASANKNYPLRAEAIALSAAVCGMYNSLRFSAQQPHTQAQTQNEKSTKTNN